MADNISEPSVWGLVPAAGRGERFGGETPKQLVDIAGRPLLSWTLHRLLSSGLRGLTVALPSDWLSQASQRIHSDDRVSWIAGGATRQDSVAACLAASPVEVDFVLVHDGARPAVAVEDVRATVTAATMADGAILGRPLDDTLKRIEGSQIISTVDRRGLFRAETPQVFRREILERAIEGCRADGFVGTDESTLVERLPGMQVMVVAARHPNPKLTESRDLAMMESLLADEGGDR